MERDRNCRLHPLLEAVVVMLLAIAASGTAAAEPRAHLVVRGECPSETQVEAAFAEEQITLVDRDSADWRVRIISAEGGALLRIARALGPTHSRVEPTPQPPWQAQPHHRTLQRSVTSDDCTAIAETFALITHSHFLDGAGSRQLKSRKIPLSPPSASSTTSSTAVRARGGALRSMGLSFGLSAGIDTTLDPNTGTQFSQADIGLRFARWGVRLAIAHDGTTMQTNNLQLLQRSQTSVRVEIAHHRRQRRLWLSTAIGGGAVVSSVRAPELQTTVERIHPTLTSSVTSGFALAGGLSLRVEIGAQIYPIADTYLSESYGEIGKSPRATIALGVGLQYDIGRGR